MKMDKTAFKEFSMPEKTLNQLYELTGGAESFKGFILVCCSEKGEPMIFSKSDSVVTEYGLVKALESYLTEYSTEYQDSE
jgi:hypothetical protein